MVKSSTIALSEKDLSHIPIIKDIIVSSIGEVLTKSNFKGIDLWEVIDCNHTVYNREKLTILIYKAINQLKKERSMVFKGKCSDNDIFFIPYDKKPEKDKFECRRCGHSLKNSKFLGMSETTGYDYECGNCGKINDTGPRDGWHNL